MPDSVLELLDGVGGTAADDSSGVTLSAAELTKVAGGTPSTISVA